MAAVVQSDTTMLLNKLGPPEFCREDLEKVLDERFISRLKAPHPFRSETYISS